MTTNLARASLVVLVTFVGGGCNCGHRGGSNGGVVGNSGIPSTVATVDFGNIAVGQHAQLQLPLTNTGDGPLTLLSQRLSGDPSFSEPTQFQTSVGVGLAVKAMLQFTPTQAGPATGLLTLTDDGNPGSLQIALKGVGVDINVAVNPTSLDFGPVQVGITLPPTKQVTFTNNGTSAITLAVDASQTRTQFSVSDPAGAIAAVGPQQTLAAGGGSYTVTVAFSPDQAVAFSSNLAWTACANAQTCISPAQVPLTGLGVDGQVQITPNPITFGTVPFGQTSNQTITLTNVGSNAVTVGCVYLKSLGNTACNGASASYAIGTFSGGTTLAAMGAGGASSFTFPLTYTASAATGGDELDADYTSQGAATVKTATDPIVGAQSQNPCAISASPASVGFGTVVVNHTGTKTVTLTNSGTANCNVSAVVVNPNDPQNDFATTAAAPYTIGSGQSQAVQVTFAPTSNAAPYTRKATLVVNSDDTVNPTLDIPLIASVNNASYAPSAWPKYHRDNANSGLSTSDTSNNTGKATWPAPVQVGPPNSGGTRGSLSTIIFSPVVGIDGQGNDVVYSLGYGTDGTHGVFVAVQGNGPSAGTTLWTAKVTLPEALAQECTPTIISDSSVYVMTGGEQRSGSDQFYHFAANGTVEWSAPTADDGFDTSPGLAPDGTMYLFDDDSPGPYAYTSITNGTVLAQPTLLWNNSNGVGHVESYSAALTDTGDESIFSWGGYIEAFDGTGREIWDNTPNPLPGLALGEGDNTSCGGNDEKSSPTLMGNDAVVSLGGYDAQSCSNAVGAIQAFNLQTGALDWTYNFTTINNVSNTWFISRQGAIMSNFSSPALVGNGDVVVGWQDGVYCITPPGSGTGTATLRWKFPGELVISSPAVGADGTIFFGSTDGNFYALDGQTGQLKFKVPVGQPINSSPAIGSDGTVYFSADDGNLYAVR